MNSSSSQPPIQSDKVPSLSPLPPVPTRSVMARFAIKTAKSISFTLYEWDTAKYKTLSNVGDDCLEEVENAICKEKGICSGKRHGSWKMQYSYDGKSNKEWYLVLSLSLLIPIEFLQWSISNMLLLSLSPLNPLLLLNQCGVMMLQPLLPLGQ